MPNCARSSRIATAWLRVILWIDFQLERGLDQINQGYNQPVHSLVHVPESENRNLKGTCFEFCFMNLVHVDAGTIMEPGGTRSGVAVFGALSSMVREGQAKGIRCVTIFRQSNQVLFAAVWYRLVSQCTAVR
jgi:hypothetical protein